MPTGSTQHRRTRRCFRGLTLIETLLSIFLIAALISILLPALNSARMSSYRDQCSTNQRRIGEAWQIYLNEHNREYPFVPVQPGWLYGGVRFSSVDGSCFPDNDRPLTAYLPLHRTSDPGELCVCCPADRGITDPSSSMGTGRRTAFRSFGISYRINAMLMDAELAGLHPDQGPRGLQRSEITATPSRLVLLGDPVWYEVAQSTQRTADWHGAANAGNILFMDGSVRFMAVKARTDRNQAAVFDPIAPGSMAASPESDAPQRPADSH